MLLCMVTTVARFAPLSRLTTEEIIEIGDELGLPHELTHKTPIDGLQPLSDEDKLGFTYHEVNELIRKGVTAMKNIRPVNLVTIM